jgi:hypothetical protein
LNYADSQKVEKFIKRNKCRSRIRGSKDVKNDVETTSDLPWKQVTLLPKEIVIPPWERPGKPTHFLSLRIKTLIPALEKYQKKNLQKVPRKFLIKPVKFHLTLAVLDLKRPKVTEETISGN